MQVALREIKAANMQHRVSIESFDWGALRLVQQQAPQIPTVALTNKDFLQAGQPGKSPLTLTISAATSSSPPLPWASMPSLPCTAPRRTASSRTQTTSPTSPRTWSLMPTPPVCR